MKTTFVIPTYNEAENLPKLASALFDLGLSDLSLLVVDDNSPDGTGQIAEDLAVQWNGRVQVMHRPGKMGLGSAYIQGFTRALNLGAEAIGQMDADFSHPTEKVADLTRSSETADLSLGSRYVPGGKLDDRWPASRKWLSGFGNVYARTILGMQIRDVTGGFRLWRAEALRRMPLERVKSNGYIFQVEMAYIASLLGFRVTEIPIYFADRRWGQSKMSMRIQLEAAYRTWLLPGLYTDLRRKRSLL